MEKIKALLIKYKPLLTDSEYEYLSYNYFETSDFYGRPKIHKSESKNKIKNLLPFQNPKT